MKTTITFTCEGSGEDGKEMARWLDKQSTHFTTDDESFDWELDVKQEGDCYSEHSVS